MYENSGLCHDPHSGTVTGQTPLARKELQNFRLLQRRCHQLETTFHNFMTCTTHPRNKTLCTANQV